MTDASRAGFRVTCARSGDAGHDIQVCLLPLHIEAGQTYWLLFRARASEPLRIPAPVLMEAGRPWSGYSSMPVRRRLTVRTEWRTYSQLYEAGVSAEDARLTFFLGGQLPAGASLWVYSLSFLEAAPGEAAGSLPVDVGNLIFDGESCGAKIWGWHGRGPQQQDEFWYDEERQVLEVYSVGNPADRHRSIEVALTRHIIDQSGASHVIYDGLVERCRLWEIYDAALTNQNNEPRVAQSDITCRDNVIWSCEYSFEYWNRPADSSRTQRIRFERKTYRAVRGGMRTSAVAWRWCFSRGSSASRASDTGSQEARPGADRYCQGT